MDRNNTKCDLALVLQEIDSNYTEDDGFSDQVMTKLGKQKRVRTWVTFSIFTTCSLIVGKLILNQWVHIVPQDIHSIPSLGNFGVLFWVIIGFSLLLFTWEAVEQT